MKKLITLLLVVVSLLLTGCLRTMSHRADGYTPDRMGTPREYIIPPGNTAGEQLDWLKQEQHRECGPGRSRFEVITGVLVGAAVGAAVAGSHFRGEGAVLGGVGGGALTSMQAGRYCSMLRVTQGLVLQQIEDNSAKSNCVHRQGDVNGRRYSTTECASTTGRRSGYQNYPR